ncbi:hypothetical protein FD35_GL001369 [Furfurilactobacillus rossiae DSM 15814]|uniref:Uncharacterized protein n=2 Tax=Furfurilactobacillus rossiae TaxID=231049 RepID=A0A0R1R8F0_9LACO|nr:hypothetical protein FD35_GL001369 [Furfurilactobacillus rossiae DSM 15814]
MVNVEVTIMTHQEEQKQLDIKRILESPTAPKEFKEQLIKRGLDGTLKYYQEENWRQFETADIFSNRNGRIDALIHALNRSSK